MTTITLPAAVPVTSEPSPIWHFTSAQPTIMHCDLCRWSEWFPRGTAASYMLSALYSHHAFACPSLVGSGTA